MKIRSIRLEHFRKFAEPTLLNGFTDGINVLAESNEFGKSTILAAIRGVLFERYSSRAQSVASMQHWSNKTSPIVTLEFALGEQLYRIEKRFLHKEPYAKLTMPDGSLHDGDAAEEGLQQILNFTRAGNTGSKAENIGMWGALWVPQRHSVDQPHLPDSARQTIHGCLDVEVGSLAGGTRGRVLLTAVRGELAKIQNGNGKAVGRYKEALNDLEGAQTMVGQLQSKRQALTKDINDLATAKHKLANVDSSGEGNRTEELLAEAQEKREAAQRYEDKEKHEISALELTEKRLVEVENEVNRRSELQTQIAEVEERVAAATAAEAEAAQALGNATEALNRQRDRVRIVKVACDEAGQALRRARSLHDLALSAQSLVGFERRLELAEAAQNHANDLAAQLLSFTVTEPGLQAARSIDARLRQVRSTLEAQASHVTLDLSSAGAGRIRVNGAPMSASSLTVIEDVILDIEGVGTIRIEPGIKDRDAQLAKRLEEERLLRSALATIAVGTLQQAEEQFAARQRCEQDLMDARREVARLTPADPALKIPVGIEALRNHIAVLRATLSNSLASAKLEATPEAEITRQELKAAELRDMELSQTIDIEQAPLLELEQRQLNAVRMHAQANTGLESALMQQESLTLEHEQALVRESADSLASRRASAAQAVVVQRGVLEQLKKNRPTDSVAALDTRIARYLEARKLFASDRTRIQQEVAILENRIEREEGVGIEEQLSEAERTRDDFELECSRFKREIKVLELLRNALEDAERVAKERYMAPVVRRITPYLQYLFPGATIHCDENFYITGIVRELRQTERFDGLSDGTQEQVAVLTRLAFADMLLDSGRPAMIILDDALAYSDSERLERMFDLLAQAASRVQIMILTCRGELFTRLGGNRIRVSSGSVV